MISLNVVIVILILLGLLLLIPVGVDVGCCEGDVRVLIRAAAFTYQIYPMASKKDPKQKKQNQTTEKKAKTFPDVSKDEVLDAISVAVKAIKKLRFHLYRLKLHFISAFADPYRTAMTYGYASAAVNAFALTNLKQGDVQLGVDFERESCYFDGYLSVTIKIYYILKLVCCMVIGILPILWRRHRRIKGTADSVAVKGKVA